MRGAGPIRFAIASDASTRHNPAMGDFSFAVFGSGAVGGYFGGRLAEAGEDVRFVARGRHLAAIREHGLRVNSVDGDFVVSPAQVTDDPVALGPVNVVILGVKAWQVPHAAEAMRPLIGERAFVVPLQNGIEAPDQLATVLGADRVLGGLCRILAYVESPGHVRHSGVTPYVAFGELDGSSSARVEALRQAFSRTRGVTAEVPPDIRVAMWSKFLFIAALSGVGALTRAPIGVIRSQPESRELLRQALEEIYAVAVRNRIALPAESGEDPRVHPRPPGGRDGFDAARHHAGPPLGARGAGGRGRPARRPPWRCRAGAADDLRNVAAAGA